ncbi:MAG: hypothetical protein KKG59_02090 [Nanoarchaeota archaeon]|nr:hypothetical protein [Nanoarchaeota archaeon]
MGVRHFTVSEEHLLIAAADNLFRNRHHNRLRLQDAITLNEAYVKLRGQNSREFQNTFRKEIEAAIKKRREAEEKQARNAQIKADRELKDEFTRQVRELAAQGGR